MPLTKGQNIKFQVENDQICSMSNMATNSLNLATLSDLLENVGFHCERVLERQRHDHAWRGRERHDEVHEAHGHGGQPDFHHERGTVDRRNWKGEF